jgi:hypothetical protein
MAATADALERFFALPHRQLLSDAEGGAKEKGKDDSPQ